MATQTRSTVVAVFPAALAAWNAVDELRRANFADDQIGIITREKDVHGRLVTHDTHWEEGAAIGALAAGAFGAVGLAGAAAAGLMIPGFGPVFGAGVLWAALTGGGAGFIAGGIVGALIGMDIPADEARFYDAEVKAGRTLLTVKADDRHDEAWALLKACGAYNVHDRGTMPAPEEIPELLPASEEDLRAAGEVPVAEAVVIEERVFEVPVRREDLAGQETTAASGPTDEGIRVPIHEDELRPANQPADQNRPAPKDGDNR